MKKLKLTTLEIKRKMGDLIQFLSGHDHIKWKRRPEKIVHGDKDGTASRNLRRGAYVFVENLRIYVHPGKSSF